MRPSGLKAAEHGLSKPRSGSTLRLCAPRLPCQISDALFRMEAPPWVRAHTEGLTGSASLDAPPSPAVAACSIEEVRAAAEAAGGASPDAIRRASQQCLAAVQEEERRSKESAEATEVRYWDRPFEFLSLGIMAYVGEWRTRAGCLPARSCCQHGSRCHTGKCGISCLGLQMLAKQCWPVALVWRHPDSKLSSWCIEGLSAGTAAVLSAQGAGPKATSGLAGNRS